MDTLALIGAILFLAGLLIFSLKLLAYNRRKYNLEASQPGPISSYLSPNTVIRVLALVIFIVAMIIIIISN